MDDGTALLSFLRKEGISEALIGEIEDFRRAYPPAGDTIYRVPKIRYYYYGTEIWEQAITAILSGENLLLSGPKATGKNVLAENLAVAFGRPSWDISFYSNVDASSLIGTDTLENGRVVLRRGPVSECAVKGGFGILDEINMAKNESVAVLHATLDFRRIIDVPGYDKIVLDDATRFIATMNYGYAGTRELNEALVSRFMVISMPYIARDNLIKLFRHEFPALRDDFLEEFVGLFRDIQVKSDTGEISSKCLDLRGFLAALRLIQRGLGADQALRMGVVNKSFDSYEQQLVWDIVRLRVPEALGRSDVFSD